MQSTIELHGAIAPLFLHITEIRDTNITEKYLISVIDF